MTTDPNDPPAPAPPPAPPAPPRTSVPNFDSAAHWRTKAGEAEAALAARDAKAREAEATAAAAVAAAKADADARVAAAEKAAGERLIRAELRALAAKEGIRDLGDLALLDISGVKMDDAGNVVDADKVMAAFKTAKPHLFGAPSTSSGAKPPPAGDPPPVDVTKMTPEQRAAHYASMGIHRPWAEQRAA